jgi:DNA polymerase-3 subunit delta'
MRTTYVANPYELCYNHFMNWEMLGHEWAVKLLLEHVTQGNHRHAYLITGSQGLGRRTLALSFAQALNCPEARSPGEPCLTCRTCKKIKAMQHPDLSVIQAEQIGGTLVVDQIRELQRSLALAPYEARYRIALLLRFEEAHPSAANALLKTLEEPPPQVILIITAESSEILLPTIVSRCEVLRLRPIAPEIVAQGLEERWNLPEDEAHFLAHISGGRPGYALKLHQEPGIMEDRQAWLRDHHALLAASRVARFRHVENDMTQGINKDRPRVIARLRGILEVWLSLWRDVLLRSSGASAPLSNPDQLQVTEHIAKHTALEEVYEMVASLERTINLLDKNVNPRLASEVLLLDLPFIPGLGDDTTGTTSEE